MEIRKLQNKRFPARRLLMATILAAYFYVLMEWIFIATKPSFMNALSTFRQVEILLVVGSLLALLCSLVLLPLLALGWFVRGNQGRNNLVKIGVLAPSGILAVTFLLMLDNFTYTIFTFGIVSSKGLARGLYAVVFLGLYALCYRSLLRSFTRSRPRKSRGPVQKVTFALLLAGTVFFALFPFVFDRADTGLHLESGMTTNRRPNILWITGDGIDAQHMSLYGYERNTTPRMRELAATSLLVENNFPNGSNTAGSVISMYTSKYASTTRVVYPPNILRGADAYQHLPGILHFQDYFTVQISYPHHVDAYTLNVLEGFDVANERSLEVSGVLKAITTRLPNDYAYFVYELANRAVDRLRHIFFIKEMKNPNDIVTQDADPINDQKKVDELLRYLQVEEQPLFAHVHLLGTHGPTYQPREQVFSQGQNPAEQGLYNLDFYDDSILDFDAILGEIIDALQASGQWENTILVVGSDHGQEFLSNKRIPLLIHFPGDEYAGRLKTNGQNLDIAPTLLDYLGLEVPGWMEGKSLLDGEPGQRPIYSFGVHSKGLTMQDENGRYMIDTSKVKPPFYQFGEISVVFCQNWYRLDLTTTEWTSGKVDGHTAPCAESGQPQDEAIIDLMRNHLQQKGFDTSSIDDYYPGTSPQGQ